ncbi:MAG: glycosyltransferase family 4 protein [Candidatus Paracaedibacteraceae bacterium]|nr:glycosyltransferase family 4 protein [Candidatus Paracaedibacteraceae bacterium]
MKILYDYQILCAQKYGGISRYYYELVSRISKYENTKIEIPALFSCNYYFENYFEKKSVSQYSSRFGSLVRYANRKYTLLFGYKNYDIIHPTYYNPYIIGRLRGKLVVTVYDMIHELYPKEFSKEDKTAEFKREMIYKSDRIIAISESTKKDILRFYPDIDQKKINVIYLGNSLSALDLKPDSCVVPDSKYVLFVGQRRAYKNFDNFIKAFAKAFANIDEMNVICTGGGPFSTDELNLINDLDLGGRVTQKSLSDNDLAIAYCNAQCFVFPSFYEGFGIPVLEAFACKCPALLSNRSSLPEVGGDAALYFNPESIDEIAEKLLRISSDEKLRSSLVKKGQERLKLFDWDTIAEDTYNLYLDVSSEG